MEKIELASDLFHYIFDLKRPHHRFKTSITVILCGNKATLIDAAYGFQMEQLLEEFSKDGIEVEQVILTHCHDDHVEGLKHLDYMRIYGHNNEKANFNIQRTTLVHYGERTLKLIPFPGHSACTMLVEIDDIFLHIADELMFSPEGEPILPLATGGFEMHINSLKKFENCEKTIIIPAHGPIFSGANLEAEAAKRLPYLQACLDADGNISYEEATKNCGTAFVYENWHDVNTKGETP